MIVLDVGLLEINFRDIVVCLICCFVESCDVVLLFVEFGLSVEEGL